MISVCPIQRTALLLLFLLCWCVVVRGQGCASLQSRIPRPDPTKYRDITDAKNWKNHELVVGSDGVKIVGVTTRDAGIPVDSIPMALFHLPDSAWPYGLVVIVVDNGVQRVDDNIPIRENRKRLLAFLRECRIEAELWPSA
jgi:hypothetical protein